jgi:hypothetical protein
MTDKEKVKDIKIKDDIRKTGYGVNTDDAQGDTTQDTKTFKNTHLKKNNSS